MASISMTRESDNSAHVLGDGKRPDSSTGTAEVIDTGDFHIDLGARQATLRGRLLDLTPAEFDLLVFLAGHPKSFVTPKTMLATNSTGGVRQAEFLRALLSLIRKLDSEFGGTQPYIRTEPWILYRFNPEASSLG